MAGGASLEWWRLPPVIQGTVTGCARARTTNILTAIDARDIFVLTPIDMREKRCRG